MATSAYPIKAIGRPVRLEGSWSSGGYNSRVSGRIGVVVLSDGTEATCCDGPHGHKSTATLTACLTRKVAELNTAAGIPVAAR